METSVLQKWKSICWCTAPGLRACSHSSKETGGLHKIKSQWALGPHKCTLLGLERVTFMPFPFSFTIIAPRMDSCCAIFSSGYRKNEVFKSASPLWFDGHSCSPFLYSLAARTVKSPVNQNTPFRRETFCSPLSLFNFHLLPSPYLPKRAQEGTTTQLPWTDPKLPPSLLLQWFPLSIRWH